MRVMQRARDEAVSALKARMAEMRKAREVSNSHMRSIMVMASQLLEGSIESTQAVDEARKEAMYIANAEERCEMLSDNVSR